MAKNFDYMAQMSQEQRLSLLLSKQDDKFALKERQKRIEEVCVPLFKEKLRKIIPTNIERFTEPMAFIGGDHDYATMRSNCRGKRKDGGDCSVRVTKQVIKAPKTVWGLEDGGLNFDRFEHACEDCQEQCSSSALRSSQ